MKKFKVKAVIDFSNRLFRIPLIATCVLLLEKCSDKEERENNNVFFGYVKGKITVDSLLDLFEKPSKIEKGVITRYLKQVNLRSDQKWIKVMFNPDRFEQVLNSCSLIVNLSEVFQPLRGNTKWSKFAYDKTLRPNIGPGSFFELDKGTVNQWGLENYAYPSLTSIRYSKCFTFTKKDWEDIASRGAKAYFFICNKPRNSLLRGVSDYIKWGETGCLTTIRKSRGGGIICSTTWVCKEREKRKEFCGWYDLGGVVFAPLFAVRHGWYKTRFAITDFSMAMYDAAIALIPKKKLSSIQIKAAAAYLNSTFCQLFIETNGRATSGGVIGLETKVAEKIPILDVTILSKEQLEKLAKLFDELEDKTRQQKGADTLEKIQSLNVEFQRIDQYIGKLVGFSVDEIEILQSAVTTLIERRTSRMKEAKPETIIGKETSRIKTPAKRKKGPKFAEFSVPLDKWT